MSDQSPVADKKGGATTARGGGPALDWKTRAIVAACGFLVRMLARTWRIEAPTRAEFDAAREQGKAAIFTFWHGQMLALLAEHRRPTTVLISDHRDGEIITQIVRMFGCRAVRGSSSKGAARALLQLSRTLDEGHDIAITPDGPRGPRHSFAPGALVLSQRTGSPIVFLAYHASSKWQLKSWDAFEIPKPFAKITVAYGKPFVVAGSDAREAALDVNAAASTLNELVQQVSSGTRK